MNPELAIWADWLKPSAGLPTVQWSLLLAAALAAGQLLQRHMGLPKVVGYSITGAVAGLSGFPGAAWPLQGIALFLLELGTSVVLFEAGGRIALRWFRHNPMVLLQSLFESLLTAICVFLAMHWLGVPTEIAKSIGYVAVAASPAVLSRVVADTNASGPVTERSMTLATMGVLYALTFVNARTGVMHRPASAGLSETLLPIAVVLGVSFIVGALLALALRMALRVMSPASENTSMLVIALIAAATPLAALLGGSAPLAALLSGLLLKQLNPRPWAFQRQLGSVAGLLTTLLFVLVCVVAARAPWTPAVAGMVAALVLARAVAKLAGVWLANWRSGTSWRQAFWTACALSPMSSVTLLLVSQFAVTSLTLGPWIAMVMLPATFLMEVLGAILATIALHRVREVGTPPAGEVPDPAEDDDG